MPEIKINIIKGSVSIESDDLYYANIRDMYKPADGYSLGVKETLRNCKGEINDLCAGISDLIYQMQDVLRR